MNTPDTITPTQLIARHSDDLASVLPSHVHAPVWVRVAQGAIRRDAKVMEAATASPNTLMVALLNAARLGLEPGTEQFYLTPRKVKGRPEILGITGYQGHIELMYRAGAVSSVVAEAVRENDEYRYRRGVDEVPVHEYPAFAGESTRGALLGVYAYARMKDGSVSRVIELGRDDIKRIKASAQGATSEYSPWRQHEEAMWLKSAVRQLEKWVPTSAEYRDQLRNDQAEVARAHAEGSRATFATVNTETGEVFEDEPVDAEVVEP